MIKFRPKSDKSAKTEDPKTNKAAPASAPPAAKTAADEPKTPKR